MDFSDAVVAYEIKVDICNQPNDFLLNTKGQGHLLTLVLDASDSVFFSSSPLKLLG